MSDQTMARSGAAALVDAGGRRAVSVRAKPTPLELLLGVTAFVLLIACANIAEPAARARSAARAARWPSACRSAPAAASSSSTARRVAAAGAPRRHRRSHRGALDARLHGGDAARRSGPEHRISSRLVAIARSPRCCPLGTGLLFGLFPALHSTRPDLSSALKGQAGQPSGARAAARFRTRARDRRRLRSRWRCWCPRGSSSRASPTSAASTWASRPDNVVTFRVSPQLNGYTSERSRQFFADLENELATQPGVSAVSDSTVPLLAGSNNNNNVLVEGFRAGPDTDTSSRTNRVGAGYFSALGIPVLAGREFTAVRRPGSAKGCDRQRGLPEEIQSRTRRRGTSHRQPVGQQAGH